ncbi:single-stranded-DNA-specific exonuclease RecJ [Rhodobacterales bacterium HKCCE2091]|nr:single-stranded-DNA-specific exonuclease RecJ [Rhodobacterales bacterium HKCCE2091]
MTAFLDVDRSLTGRTWQGPDPEHDRIGMAIAQAAGLPLPLSLVLARQGVGPDTAAAYLEPTLRDLLPDPLSLKDMDRVAGRLLAALERGEKIAVFADYDVDGGASAALLIDWFRVMGRDVTLYVPDRIDEGYGPNEPAMAELAAAHDLIVCVDCGTLSHGPIAAAKDADVVVLDHHLAGADLPDCAGLVNPNRPDDTSGQGHLCAAAVVFLALVELNRLLRAAGRRGPDLMGMLDLVALATVADVAPLTGANRALVRQGLKIMAQRGRPGLVALSDIARLDRAPDAYHLGYVLGPRVNAGGRIGRADLGARCLSTLDRAEAAELAAELDRLNGERREIEDAVRLAALAQCEGRDDPALAWAAEDGWHPGVVGIVASRLKEAMNRPAVVIGFDGDAGKGSGRSVAGVDLGASIQKLAAEGLIEKGGGHKMAAGLSLTRAQLEPAMARLSELLARQGAGEGGRGALRLDGLLAPAAATVDLVEALETAGPFGQGAPAPRFALPALRITQVREVGTGHLKLGLTDGSARLDAIAFRAFETPLGTALAGHAGRLVHVAGRVELNHWQGRTSVQLKLDDAAFAE